MSIKNGYRQSLCASVLLHRYLEWEKSHLIFFSFFFLNCFLMEVNHWHPNPFDPPGAEAPPARLPGAVLQHQGHPPPPAETPLPLPREKTLTFACRNLRTRDGAYLKWHLCCKRQNQDCICMPAIRVLKESSAFSFASCRYLKAVSMGTKNELLR